MSTRVLPNFTLLSPGSFADAIELAKEYAGRAMIFAGGTDVLVKMKSGNIAPSVLIGIRKISGLDEISYDIESGLSIGTLTTIRAIETSSVIAQYFPFLQDIAHVFANSQLLNMGTLGGNICNASPAGDMIPALLSMNAEVDLVSISGKRTVKLVDFFTGPGKTVMKSDELLRAITAPAVTADYGTSFVKICRTAEDLAKVSVATVLTQHNGKFKDVRISLGAVAPTVFRAREVEAFLEGREINDTTISKAMVIACDIVRPISDLRSTAEYRKAVTGVALKQSIGEALRRSTAR